MIKTYSGLCQATSEELDGLAILQQLRRGIIHCVATSPNELHPVKGVPWGGGVEQLWEKACPFPPTTDGWETRFGEINHVPETPCRPRTKAFVNSTTDSTTNPFGFHSINRPVSRYSVPYGTPTPPRDTVERRGRHMSLSGLERVGGERPAKRLKTDVCTEPELPPTAESFSSILGYLEAAGDLSSVDLSSPTGWSHARQGANEGVQGTKSMVDTSTDLQDAMEDHNDAVKVLPPVSTSSDNQQSSDPASTTGTVADTTAATIEWGTAFAERDPRSNGIGKKVRYRPTRERKKSGSRRVRRSIPVVPNSHYQKSSDDNEGGDEGDNHEVEDEEDEQEDEQENEENEENEEDEEEDEQENEENEENTEENGDVVNRTNWVAIENGDNILAGHAHGDNTEMDMANTEHVAGTAVPGARTEKEVKTALAAKPRRCLSPPSLFGVDIVDKAKTRHLFPHQKYQIYWRAKDKLEPRKFGPKSDLSIFGAQKSWEELYGEVYYQQRLLKAKFRLNAKSIHTCLQAAYSVGSAESMVYIRDTLLSIGPDKDNERSAAELPAASNGRPIVATALAQTPAATNVTAPVYSTGSTAATRDLYDAVAAVLVVESQSHALSIHKRHRLINTQVAYEKAYEEALKTIESADANAKARGDKVARKPGQTIANEASRAVRAQFAQLSRYRASTVRVTERQHSGRLPTERPDRSPQDLVTFLHTADRKRVNRIILAGKKWAILCAEMGSNEGVWLLHLPTWTECSWEGCSQAWWECLAQIIGIMRPDSRYACDKLRSALDAIEKGTARISQPASLPAIFNMTLDDEGMEKIGKLNFRQRFDLLHPPSVPDQGAQDSIDFDTGLRTPLSAGRSLELYSQSKP